MPTLRSHILRAQTLLYRVYDSTWGYDEHNPGFGDARFSPFEDPRSGLRVPTMYLAASPTAALLETIFHEVHAAGAATIYERDLRDHLLAHVMVPSDARLGDLRDPELARHHVGRGQIVSSPAEHYPCTRRVVAAAYASSSDDWEGLIWHSRQTELVDERPAEVLVLFGSRYPAGRGTWRRASPGSSNLYEGPGRLFVEEVAERLQATIETED